MEMTSFEHLPKAYVIKLYVINIQINTTYDVSSLVIVQTRTT